MNRERNKADEYECKDLKDVAEARDSGMVSAVHGGQYSIMRHTKKRSKAEAKKGAASSAPTKANSSALVVMD